MSLILKGIDLPRNQTITIHYANKYGEMETVFVDENDIIQIPKGHGRIGDLDEVKRKGADDGYDFYVSWTDIDEVPTILEAEE